MLSFAPSKLLVHRASLAGLQSDTGRAAACRLPRSARQLLPLPSAASTAKHRCGKARPQITIATNVVKLRYVEVPVSERQRACLMGPAHWGHLTAA
jgi:hypothetical protein